MKLNRGHRIGVVLSVIWALGAAIYISNSNARQAISVAGMAYDNCIKPVRDRIRTDCSQEYTKAYEASYEAAQDANFATFTFVPIPFGWGITYLFIRIYRRLKAGERNA